MDKPLIDNASRSARSWMSASLPHEDVRAYLIRLRGSLDRDALGQLLGAANPFKEGDDAIGVAAPDEQARSVARAVLRSTRVHDLESLLTRDVPLFSDSLSRLLQPGGAADDDSTCRYRTLGEWVDLLLAGEPALILAAARTLSSEVIACLVKLMSNDELTRVGARLGNPLPGSRIGTPGVLGARLQPNSPTDHPDDIRWQVFSGWSFGVGDVLLGTNPVSSDPDSVAALEHTLQDVIHAFGLTQTLPHCVLAHIDVQADVERAHHGSTALWFQSIAGSDAANKTFDISVDSMIAHASTRTGRFALYFETGQGADCTNGHGRGVDMVIHESRKYGFARALSAVAASARAALAADTADDGKPWVIVNDVAGFIGPEVFRTREQLVRCCLEDLVMGKLHGLTIGLDVCATLHMDISLDDLDWCLDQLVPACPAYLMALPTKIDPMLGYLTTGFQDHVRLRAKYGCRVDPPMQAFFESIGAMNEDGGPGPHFGDPLHVYVAYRRHRGDARAERTIRAEGAAQMADVRARGVFLAEGHGVHSWDLAPALDHAIRRIADDARLALQATLPPAFVEAIPDAVPLTTRSTSREDYILHATTGELLSESSRRTLSALRLTRDDTSDLQIVISDGLNALAISETGHAMPFVDALRTALIGSAWTVAPDTIVVERGRVRVGYRIGEELFAGRDDTCAIVHLIGERPGTGHNTMSVYVTAADGAQWSVPNAVDHDITRVVSGIAHTATAPDDAARQVVKLLMQLGSRAPAGVY